MNGESIGSNWEDYAQPDGRVPSDTVRSPRTRGDGDPGLAADTGEGDAQSAAVQDNAGEGESNRGGTVWATDAERPTFKFTIKDIQRTFSLSRATLIYYEQHGIVLPKREESSDYRIYSEADVFRLMSAAILKGLGVAPRDIADRMSGDPYSDECFEGYLAAADRRIAYEQAVRRAIVRLEELRRHEGQVGIVDIDPYYICWDNAENGYHDFSDSKNLAALIEHMPVGGLGSQLDEPGTGRLAEETINRWGRTVAVRDAWLIEGFDAHAPKESMAVIGGARCACAVYLEDSMYPGESSSSGSVAARRALADYVERHRLVPADARTFCPFSLPTAEGFYVPMCLPIRIEGDAGAFSQNRSDGDRGGARPRGRVRDWFKRLTRHHGGPAEGNVLHW